MSKRAEIALRGAIKSWKTGKLVKLEWASPDSCPLCKLYIENDCKSCPIQKATGVSACIGTPYILYDRVWNRTFRGLTNVQAKKHARAMIKFMEGLLP